MPPVRGFRTSRQNYINKKNYFNSYGKTTANHPVDSTSNKAVKRVYKKATTPKTKTGQNKTAIMTLARQVKSLQNSRFGELQTHTQYALFTGENKPLAAQPIAFCLNDFYDQIAKKGVITGGVATYANAVQFVRHTYQADLNDEHEWNARRNEDAVSSVEYKPVYTRCQIGFETAATGHLWPSSYRVTVLKMKPHNNTNKLAINIPMNLGAYRNLAGKIWEPTRNYLDKRYHDVLFDKWITVRANNKLATEQASMRHSCTISWKYRDQVIIPDFTNNPASQEFFTNVPVKDQIWVLISVPADLQGNLLSVEVSKFDVWRDKYGTSN